MNTHLRRSHDFDTFYDCKHCDYATISKQSLIDHIEASHDVESMICDQCPFTALHTKILKDHLIEHTLKDRQNSVHHPHTLMQCSGCDFMTPDIALMTHHMKRHNSVSAVGIVPKDTICENVGMQEEVFEDRVEPLDGGGTLYQCSDCSFTSQHAEIFLEHLSNIHQVNSVENHASSTNTEPIVNSSRKLIYKQIINNDKNFYKCLLCGYFCEHLKTMKSHTWKHSGHKDIDYPMFSDTTVREEENNALAKKKCTVEKISSAEVLSLSSAEVLSLSSSGIAIMNKRSHVPTLEEATLCKQKKLDIESPSIENIHNYASRKSGHDTNSSPVFLTRDDRKIGVLDPTLVNGSMPKSVVVQKMPQLYLYKSPGKDEGTVRSSDENIAELRQEEDKTAVQMLDHSESEASDTVQAREQNIQSDHTQRKSGISTTLLAVIEQMRGETKTSPVKNRSDDVPIDTKIKAYMLNGEAFYQCEICHYKNSRKRTVQSHMMKKHRTRSPLQCSLCEFVAESIKHLQEHTLEHCQVSSQESHTFNLTLPPWFTCFGVTKDLNLPQRACNTKLK